MKFKIPQKIDLHERLKRMKLSIEYWAKFLVLIFGIVLATITITSVLPILPEDVGIQLAIFLILFIIAATVVFTFEANRLLRGQSSKRQKSTEIPAHTEQFGRNRWISIGLLVLVAAVISLIFIARQLPPTPQGYQTFYTAFAATGAWITGIALAVFTYQQYKLRQTEHSLLFNPQILLSSSVPITGEKVYNTRKYPYCIEWSVSVQNTSSVPVIIEYIAIKVKSAKGDLGREEYIPYDCYFILEPDGLEPPFQVTLAAPQRIKYVIAGRDMAQVLDYVASDSNSRVFELIFKVRAITPQSPTAPTINMETISIPCIVPENAKWVSKTPFLDEYKKGKKVNHNKD